MTLRSDDADVMDIAREILTALKHYFPDIGLSLPKFVSVVPERLHAEFPSLPSSTPDLPCHNFRRSYVALCDYYDHPFRDEIVWVRGTLFCSLQVDSFRMWRESTSLTTFEKSASRTLTT